MIPVIIISMFFVTLLYLYYKVSVEGKVSTFQKWILAICSIGVLAIVDKVKLLVWVVLVCVMLMIKHFTKKNKRDELA